MRPERIVEETFNAFVQVAEEKLSFALAAAYGPEIGSEATAEALAYAWENWRRVRAMDNPLGYLFRVGQSKARRYWWRRPPIAPLPPESVDHVVEPGLLAGLEQLSRNQRTCVVLVDGFGWTQQEVAELLGVTRSSVQKHHERGLNRLCEILRPLTEIEFRGQTYTRVFGGSVPAPIWAEIVEQLEGLP